MSEKQMTPEYMLGQPSEINIDMAKMDEKGNYVIESGATNAPEVGRNIKDGKSGESFKVIGVEKIASNDKWKITLEKA